MPNKTINGHYSSQKQDEAWMKERREYTRCGYSTICNLYREASALCQDFPDECPIKRNLALLITQQTTAVAEGHNRLGKC